MSKRPMNFRLSHQATTILDLLEEKLHTSKTAIIEAALQSYAKHRLSENKLLKYAGILEDNEAENMLKDIKTSRKNKQKGIEF